MSRAVPDRRHPHITFADLRRDLRQADQDLFMLSASAGHDRNHRRGGSGTPLALAIALSAALAGVAWAARPAPRLSTADAVQVDLVAPAIALTAREPLEAREDSPEPLAAASDPTADNGHISAIEAQPPRPSARQHRPLASPPAHRDRPAPRNRPRPLSPGEFGRTPAL